MVDRAARIEDADKVRCYAMHDALRRVLRRNGYFNVKSTIEVSVKVNAVQGPKGSTTRPTAGTFTYGDSDQDH